MRILHLSDFHIRDKGENSLLSEVNYKRYIRKLYETVEASLDRQTVDYLVTTGDYIDRSDFGAWTHASKIVEELIRVFKISRNDLLFCNGNHDLRWSEKTKKRTISGIRHYCDFVRHFHPQYGDKIKSLHFCVDESNPEVAYANIDCLFTGASFDDQANIDEDTLSQFLGYIEETQPRLLLVCAHNPPFVARDDIELIKNENYKNKVLKNGPLLISELKKLDDDKKPIIIWFSGEVHKPTSFYEGDPSLLSITTGRFAGNNSSGVAPSATVVDLTSSITVHRFSWFTKEHEESSNVGQWQYIVPPERPKTDIDFSFLDKKTNRFQSIDDAHCSTISDYISENRLLSHGRFQSIGTKKVALFWLQTEELIGSKKAPREVIAEGLSKVTSQLVREYPFTDRMTNCALVGLGVYGSLLAGMIGPKHGLKIVALPPFPTKRQNILEENQRKQIIKSLSDCSLFIFLTDVVRSGSSAKHALDMVRSLRGSSFSDESADPKYHLLSIVSAAENQELKSNIQQFNSCWSFINGLNLLLLDQNDLPPTKLFPETRFL